jgi:prepilin-type N-terminal cleavage/methylation domain-containing protein
MTTAPRNRLQPNAFTLVELLVVIGIIAILVGILLPVINRVKYATYRADTENEISQISNACNAYYSTYHAYPGPFSNFETQWGGGGMAGSSNPVDRGTTNEQGFVTLAFIYNGTNYTQISSTNIPTYFVTGAENLVLGLMGGLRVAPANTPAAPPTNIAFAPAEVGLGPMSLNPLNPSRQPAFFPAGSTYLMWNQQGGGGPYQSTTYNPNDPLIPFTDPAHSQASDSPIPEFVDRYPSPGPLPILYLRARVGAKGVVSDGTIQDPSITSAGVTAQYQYDLRDIVNYTNPAANPTAAATAGTTLASIGLQNLNTTPNNVHDLAAIEANPAFPSSAVKAGPANPNPGPQQTTNLADAFAYFCNQSIAPTNITSGALINYSAHPRAVDQFILISAGPDGIYGTTDDITSFGDVSQ